MKKYLGLGLLAAVVGSAPAAFADTTPVDLSSLSSAVDFSTTTTAVLAVFAALAAVFVAMKAGRLVLRAIR